MKKLLPIGTRIYNGGDMANMGHFGTITAIKDYQYQITPDPEDLEDYENDGSIATKPYWVTVNAFSDKYNGTGLTRFVTEKAYDEWRQEQLNRFKNCVNS